MRRRRQIEDILKKCDEVEKSISEKMDIGEGGRKVVGEQVHLGKVNIGRGPLVGEKDKDQNLSRSVVKTMIMYEVKSCQLNISPSELDEVANRM